MWEFEDVEIWGCGDLGMKEFENLKMWEFENEST